MEIDKLKEWNPWWEDAKLVTSLTGIYRLKYASLIDAVDLKEVIIITGVRRAGKSTLMYQMVDKLLKKGVNPKQILFLNFEDKKINGDSLDDIYTSYRENLNLNKKAYIFFDEIHKRSGWESWIRGKYDQKSNDKFVISGSCSYLLKKEYSTLLTGRNLTFEIFPLSFTEFLYFKGITVDKENIVRGILLDRTKIIILNSLKEYINHGGFPEVLFKPEAFKTKLLEQYFDDILYKDIVDRYSLNVQKAKDLAIFLMSNFTSLVSLRNVRNSLKLSYDAVKDYLAYFSEAFLFFTLDYFSYSLKEQKTMASKVYCIDNGLRNAVAFKFSEDLGKLTENLVFIELVRNENEVYYWKNQQHEEVDFVIKEELKVKQLIQVCYDISAYETKEREVKALLKCSKELKCNDLLVITWDYDKIEIVKGKKIKFMALWKWLLKI